jgi:signal transduction histidine kinase
MMLLARERGLTLQVVVPDLLPHIALDRARMEQVLLNLVQNALVFTPPGGTITLSAVREGDYAIIHVHDTGVGIAPEDVPHIFERFYKADQARSGGGLGLGLAIAKHLVERHGGQIQVASQIQQGTTVTISLPLHTHQYSPQC